MTRFINARLAMALVAVSVGFAAAACVPPSDALLPGAKKVGATPDPTLVAAGKTKYTASCAGCHGSTGQGGSGPSVTGQTFAQLKAKMAGSMATYMAGFTDDDLRGLEAFLVGS